MLFSLTLPVLAAFLTSVLAEDLYDYAIYPKDGTNSGQTDTVTSDLEAIVGPTPAYYLSKSDDLGVFFWFTALTEQQASDFQSSHKDSIATVSQSCAACFNNARAVGDHLSREPLRKRAINLQDDAADDLKVISQEPGVALSDMPGYYYDDSAGQSTRVYVIDSGAANNFDYRGKQVDWIFAGPHPSSSKDDPSGHGTCMLSKVIGEATGVAKKAKNTMVRSADDNGVSFIESTIDALVKTYDDIKANNYGGQAVVSMSWGVYPKNYPNTDPEPAYTTAWKGAYTTLLKALIALEVIPVIAAGNNGGTVNGYPASLGSTISGLIVVGGVDNDGNEYSSGQTADFVKVSAPAVDVLCSDADDDDDLIEQSGTSLACAMVAGLIATLLTTGTAASDVQHSLYDLAYDRVNGGPKVVYNGLGSPPGVVATVSMSMPAPVSTGSALTSAAANTTASPVGTATSQSSGTPTFSCEHAADPQNTCAAIADSTGYCECSDGNTYAEMSGTGICAYTAAPTSTLSFNCATTPATPAPTTTPSAAPTSSQASPTSASTTSCDPNACGAPFCC